MLRHRCNPQNCTKKEKCNHYLVRGRTESSIVEEDLSDICKEELLFIEGDYLKNFPSKHYYEKLLAFYDGVCNGTETLCQHRKEYNTDSGASCISCKYGKCEEFTCNHNKHPDNAVLFGGFSFLIAENEAFKAAGIKYGRVEFTCPLCGGKAVGNRYKEGGLGSGCSKCGFRHS